jgi:hypothetical protein
MYLSEWVQQATQLKEWFKFRKMIVINPFEQLAVVGSVGTFGPADWLQKQFGGSPEVMASGKIWSPQTRGRVLLFFVNDIVGNVELGPRSLKFGA